MRLVRVAGATELPGEVVEQMQRYAPLARIRDLGLELP
jgi:hypothetical protein